MKLDIVALIENYANRNAHKEELEAFAWELLETLYNEIKHSNGSHVVQRELQCLKEDIEEREMNQAKEDNEHSMKFERLEEEPNYLYLDL